MSIPRTFTALAALLTLALTALPSQAQDTGRIAFIDMARAFDSYHETKRFEQRLQERASEYEARVEDLTASLRAMEEEFNTIRDEARDPTLSDEARKRKQAEAEEKILGLREKQMELRQLQDEGRKEIEAQGRRMRERVVEKIDRIIEDYATERGLFAVLDSSGASLNQVSVVVYRDARADITDQIIALLNEGQEELSLDDPTPGGEAEEAPSE